MKTIFTKITLSLCCTIITIASIAQTLEEQLSTHIDIVVDSAGNGDHTTLTAALNAASNGNVIFLRKGTYHEKVAVTKSGITLIGADINETKISYGDHANRPGIGTSSSHTLIADGNDFTAMNLTIENYNGDSAQAVALNLHGDRQMVLNCRVTSGQDTFYTWGAGRFYIKDSYLEGHTDFIFGRGAAYFENSLIVTKRTGSPVTAASTDEGWEFGYVFNNCKFDGWTGISSVPLGRPWKPYCQVVIMNSYLGNHIATNQWNRWNDTENHLTTYYGQYNNSGPGYHPESTPDWTHILTDEEAARYTKANVLAKTVRSGSDFSSDWNPDMDNDPIYQIVKQNSIEIQKDTLYYQSIIKSISFDGEVLTPRGGVGTYYEISLQYGDTTFDESRIDVVTLDPLAHVKIREPEPDKYPGNVFIIVTARNGAAKSYALAFSEIPLSNKKEHLTDDISVYPSPAQNVINFDLENLTSAPKALNIYTLSGVQVISVSDLENSTTPLNVSHLPKGLYLYELIMEGNTLKGKFIK